MSRRVLLVSAPLLMIAVAVHGQAPATVTPPAALVDLTGRPLPHAPLLGFEAAAGPAVARDDQSRQDGSLRDPRADALHALPDLDVMRVAPSRTDE